SAAWESRSCRRTSACSPTGKRASARSAAKSSVRSGNGVAVSRIGMQPITIPSGVDVTIDGARVAVKGPTGELDYTLVGGVSVSRSDDALVVERADDSRTNRSLHGLQRTLIANMVTGVSEGFTKELEIVGVGYRAQAQGSDKIEISVGFSHPVHV